MDRRTEERSYVKVRTLNNDRKEAQMEPRAPYKRKESLPDFAKSLNARASDYVDSGEYAKALEFFREAERLFQFLGE